MKKFTSFALVLAVFVSTFGASFLSAYAAGPITPVPTPTPTVNQKVIMLGGRTTIPGSDIDNNDVWQSRVGSGQNWTQLTANAPWSGRFGHAVLYFNNAIYVIAGKSPDNSNVWKSLDGINWTQTTANLPFFDRSFFASYVFNNKMWIVGGMQDDNARNDVWSSTDGITWIQEISNANFSPRGGMSYAVFNNAMWIFGGLEGPDSTGNYTPTNDVWKSTNGITWTRVVQNAQWSPRWGATSVIFNNKMWILGGETGGTVSNQKWYSTNGTTWTQAPSSLNSTWSPRALASSYVLGGAMFTLGGIIDYSGLGTSTNDVWKSVNGTTWNQTNANAPWSARSGQAIVVVPASFGTNVPPPPPCTPTLRLVSPNGGEVYTPGQQITITWTSTCIPSNQLMHIDLATSNASGTVIQNTALMSFTGIVNDGSEIVTIPANVPTANNYRIRIDTGTPLAGYSVPLADHSDANFTINTGNLTFERIDAGFTDQTISPASYPYTTLTGVFQIRNNSNEPININNITITSGNTTIPLSSLTNLIVRVYDWQTAPSYIEYGPSSFSAVNNISVSQIIPPGESIPIDVIMDINSASSGQVIQLGFNTTGIGTVSNTLYPIGGATQVLGQVTTIN